VVLDKVGPPHGGHGGTPGHRVPPARAPIEDISRDRINEVLDTVTRPEDLPKPLVDLRTEWIDAGGHGGLRHDHTQTGDQALRDRCTKGHDPITASTVDWETGEEHQCGRDASAFVSPATVVFAEARLWRSPEAHAERAIADKNGDLFCPVSVDALAALGAAFPRHLAGYTREGSKRHPTGSSVIHFPADTKIFALYRRDSLSSPWYLYTIYPRRPSP
jgi:hypothetical protein